jgi:hypothetical protein
VFYQVCPKWLSSLWYARHKPCTYIALILRLYLQTDRNEISHDLGHLDFLSGVSKAILEPVVRSAQTVHLSCIKNSTISKWTKTSIHLSLVTLEYHRVRSKRFLWLWNVWRKRCTYLAPILTLSLNGLKWDFTWPTSPRCSIGCVQNDFWACDMFIANPCTNLASRLGLSPNGPKQASTWVSSPRSTIWCVQNDFWAYGMFGANRTHISHWY